MPASVASYDQHLVERAQAGDAAAFEALMKPYVAPLRRITYSFCRDWTEADDLAQDALLKVFRSLSTFASDTDLTAWVYSVTRSVCTDWYRSSRSRGRQHEVPLDEELSDQSDGQEGLLRAKDEAEQLWRAIRCLEPNFRVPLVLFDIEGMSYDEIARIERIPVGTVRSRLSRARQQVHDLLASKPRADVVPTPLAHYPPRTMRLQSER